MNDFIGVQLTDNVVLVSAIQNSESVIHTHMSTPKMANFIDKCCMCSDYYNWLAITHLSLFESPYSLRHNNIEIRPVNNPEMALSVQMKGRVTYFLL